MRYLRPPGASASLCGLANLIRYCARSGAACSLQFQAGETPETLGLTGRERFSIDGLAGGEANEVTVRADDRSFTARVRLDTPREREYLRHGGILPFVLRRLLAA